MMPVVVGIGILITAIGLVAKPKRKETAQPSPPTLPATQAPPPATQTAAPLKVDIPAA